MHLKSTHRAGKWLLDAIVTALAFPVAYLIRFEGSPSPTYLHQLYTLVGILVAGRLLTNAAFRLSRQKWAFLEPRDLALIALSYTTFSSALLLVRFSLGGNKLLTIPLGVLGAELVLSLLGAWSIRLLRRLTYEYWTDSNEPRSVERLLLVGANTHAATIAHEMSMRKGIKIVGFVDDDPQKLGLTFGGIPVLGSVGALADITKRHGVTDVLICLPPEERTDVPLAPHSSGVRMRVMPTIEEVIQSQNGGGKNGAMDTARLAFRIRTESNVKARRETLVSGQTILITGGAGFIGSNLAQRLAAKNKLILFDTTFDGKPIQFTGLPGHRNVKLVQGNILSDSPLHEICRDVDMVVHAAAVLGVGRVCGAARETLETNYIGTSRLLRALEGNSRLSRFVYFSTSEVFGVNSYRVGESAPPTMGPIAEARWSYAMSKLAGEHLVQSYYRETKMPTVIVRPFNVFGPRRTGDYALRRFIVNAIDDKDLEVHGDGSQIRSWCFIEDFCDALTAMLELPEAVGEDFNVGNPANTVTVKDLARRVIELAGSSSRIAFIENPFPDIQIRVPSLDKAQHILGFNPQYDLDTALARTIDWHRENWDHFAKAILPDRGEKYNAIALPL